MAEGNVDCELGQYRQSNFPANNEYSEAAVIPSNSVLRGRRRRNSDTSTLVASSVDANVHSPNPSIITIRSVDNISNMANRFSPEPAPDLSRDRLPTLFEVLARRTLAPVDLYFFYIYMRDQQRAVDYLDFW